MGLLGAINFSLALVSLSQVLYSAEGCKILSVSSPGPSSLFVKWEKTTQQTGYMLDIRDANINNAAPVIVFSPSHTTEKTVYGLRPGVEHNVTLKVLNYYTWLCWDSVLAFTVPTKSQITYFRALTSTSILIKWEKVPSAERYYLVVESDNGEEKYNLTFTGFSTVVQNLKSSTNYNCAVFTANQGGLGRSSKVKTVTTLMQPPVSITMEQTGESTARVIWVPVSKVLVYRVTIKGLDEASSKPTVYNVTSNTLDIAGILPCSNYLILVSSYNVFMVPGEPSNVTYTTNKLAHVTAVTVDYICTTDSATVRWTPVFGAEYYEATAVGENNRKLTCEGQGSDCQITGLSCDQSYTVHVIPVSENCKNMVNTTTVTFQTAPCPPQNLSLLRTCSSNTILFSWDHTNNTDHYKAKAVDSKGVVQDCLTTDNSCYFTHSVCGRHYEFMVYSIRGSCHSQTSATVGVKTAPCAPQHLKSSAKCDSSDLVTVWDHADGALNYTLEALGNKGSKRHYSCSSFTNSCVIEDVHCGEHLSVYITAFDEECSSQRTLGPVAETVPCVPQSVAAVRDCGADSVTVSWNTAGNALFHTASAMDSNGVIYTCQSGDSSCQIKGLQCSTNYTAYVTSSSIMCTSKESEKIIIETAACPPDHVSAALNCTANEALISWHDLPEINSYTASLVDTDHGLLSCSSTTTGCKISNLKCSQLYTVTVWYHDGVCHSMPSEPIYLESVPCGPDSVQANMNCASGELSLGWNESKYAEGYITLISDSEGQASHRSPEPQLNVNTMTCGHEYTVTVRSFNGTCVSFPSQTVTVTDVPCVPTNVVAEKNCGQSFVAVTWHASRGAKNYTAAAVDKDGRRFECSSNQTWCRFEDLLCGQVYTVSVVAVDDTCSSMASTAVTLQTAPCAPSGLTASVNCSSNGAMLAWAASPNSVSYTGKAVSTDGHTVTCDAGLSLGCYLEGLYCGQEYTFTVSATDGNCSTPDSPPVIRTTAPCAMEGVLNTLNCSANMLTISWEQGSMPGNYSATAVSGDGTALQCTTVDSSCTLTNLKCGQEYTVKVKSFSSTCEGQSSEPQTVYSVPCLPTNIQGDVDCSSNTLQTSWDASDGAVSYISTLKGPAGFSTSCFTTDQTCHFPNLMCAQKYVFSVVALNDQCNSSNSAEISVWTAPCDPVNVTTTLDCLSGSVAVSWKASAGAEHYTAVAHSSGHHHVIASCKSTGTSCNLPQLQCGEEYTVSVLAGDGTCNSTALTSTSIKTAPCPPVILHHSLDCGSNRTLVSWAKDEDAINVTVHAHSSLGHSTSCSSGANSSCILENLQCGQTYTVQAVAKDEQCLSNPSQSLQIVTAPCTPAHVEYTYSCGTSITLLSWDDALGRERFYAQISSGDYADSCSTTETYCSITSLLCGHQYDVKVTAVAAHCNSSQPGVTQMTTAPCAPQNVSASLVCSNNTAAVSWLHSAAAKSYKVKAVGRDGDTKYCTTNGTSCHLPNMHCAQTYTITVTPFSDSCTGFDSTPFVYVAGPCPPANVQVSLQCDSNVGHVTWSPADNADLYVVTGVVRAADKQEHACNSSGTSCYLTDLHCGEMVEVTVVTIERGCQSEPSAAVAFKSAICPPTGVAGVTNCATSDITISWSPSPEGGVTYFVHSQKEGGANASYSTTQTSYVTSGMQCGELVTLTVAVKDSDCTSALSQPIEIETAPCPPTSLTSKADCGTNLGTLTWSPSTHAVSYTATMTGTHGHVASCTSNVTSCSAKLDCGHEYSAAVVASTMKCNSSAGASLTFNSAPCLPKNVSADLDCSANAFAVSWRGSTGDGGSYTAIAIGSDGSRLTCDSSTTNCDIQSLKCGLTYSVVVSTASVDCGTIDGSDYSMQSAPCKPQTLTVALECSTNIAAVSWDNAGPDQVHVVSAVDGRGVTTTCTSSSSNCTLSQLTCGEVYAMSAIGKTEGCSSDPAVAPDLHTAPCVPTHPVATVDCQTGITSVTWDGARGATGYSVYARGSLGHNAVCNNTDTNCYFPSLACGQDYTITVVAHHATCHGLASEAITATTGPCPHADLKTSLDCSTNTALVSWTPGSGILHYNATAEGLSSSHHLSCSTNGSSCNISSLHCGESYKVSVTGHGRNCESPAHYWHTVNTAPCPPTLQTVNSSCQSNDITVSWGVSRGSATYMAVAENSQGHKVSCNTSTTTCQISGLICGQQYEVYVVGVNEKCVGAKSASQMIRTAPCVPQHVHHHLDCMSGDLNITWESTGYAPYFYVTVQSSSAGINTCKTEERHCVIPSMQCGLTYSATVLAHDEACNSSHSATQQISAAPCPPTSFQPTVDCLTGVVTVTWQDSAAAAAALYTVSAVDASGRRHNCSSTASSCDLSTLECGTEYNVTVTPSRNGCVGRTSPPKTFKSSPCVPHLTDVEMDCLTNSAWVMWEESAAAEGYIVLATKDGHSSYNASYRFECSATADRMCGLPELKCGENLTFTLQARSEYCISAPSNAVTTETAPCPPESIEKTVACENGTIEMSWSASPGAVTYTATLEQANGDHICCSTSDTSCKITDLPCGTVYVLLVAVEGRTCNSTPSSGILVGTEPCVPENLQVSLSCSSNVASMSWNYSTGGLQYQVTAVGDNGHADECSSHSNKCDLTGLQCGQRYRATVVAKDLECTSAPSDSVSIKTVPCTPANFSSAVDCEAGSLVISWTESSGADSYLATVHDSDGLSTSCQATTQGFCSVPGAACGQIYHTTLVSSDGYCDSPPTHVIDTPSVPCDPTHISAMMDCSMKTAIVSWFPSDGALSYVLTATAASGHTDTCEVNTTHCELEALHCGQSYSISVKALGKNCSSIAHMSGQLVTEPCVPQYITTQYSVGIGQVTWDMSAGAQHYTVEAQTEQGLTVGCVTNDTNCALYNMACSRQYIINVTAHSNVCHDVSTSSESVVIETEPCPPSNVETSVACQSGAATVSWEESPVAVAYSVSLSGRDGHALSCYSAHAFCSVTDLHCGTVYYTDVVAVGKTLNSTSSTTVLLTSAPCAAENVKAEVDCDGDKAHVSWSSASGAKSYRVTAAGSAGHRTSCDTNADSCYVTELQCGQTYNVSLAAIGDDCQTQIHTNVSFSTRPCQPTRVGADLECGTRAAHLHWEEKDEVELYVATATCSTGTTLQCNSTNSTCQFRQLECGETYTFSVTAHGRTCQSAASSPVDIQTEPCQPLDLTVAGSCDNETLVLDWMDARGAKRYVVWATGDLGYVTALRTNGTMAELQLPCGQTFTFTVKSQDDQCDGPPSPPADYKTGPCVPQHVHSYTHCEDSVGSVSWAASDGADYYLAFAEAADGHIHTCTTNTSHCTWDDLHCGEIYTIHVIASDYMCSSAPSNTTSIRMAPCAPQNLISSLNCSTKVGSLSWNASETADLYVVTAESDGGHKVELSTADTWAYMSEFMCGQEYYLTVKAVDSVCRSASSQPSKLIAEPCQPTGVSSFMDCFANTAMISWNGSAGAQFYTATVTDEDGQSKACLSNITRCGVADIRCGQNYTVTVVATNQQCDSEPSDADALESVPCVPADVTAAMDCSKNVAHLSWSASEGALSYNAMVQNSWGDTVSSCETPDLTCTVTNLTCGQSFSVEVVALDDTCSSLPSQAVNFNSVPCTPNISSVALDCYTNSALLSWGYADGAVYYTATAHSANGHVSTCTSNFTNCELKKLTCGQTYTVSTVASDGQCDSALSASLQVDSVPCAPGAVVAEVDCAMNSARVAWQSSAGADSYIVQAIGVQEHASGCETASQSCIISDLMCGFTYNISVVAVNSVCNVTESAVTQLQAVPCVPQQVEARVDCGSGDVAVSWEHSKGASSYTTVAIGNGGYAATCNSSETSCHFSDLLCGHSYSVTVSASSHTCASAGSSALQISTVPCVPQTVSAEMMCSNNTGLVSWEEGDGATSYTVHAFGPDGHRAQCSSTATSCQLPNMHCGQLYNLTVTAQDGRCDDSNAYFSLQSAPCRPTNVKAALQCHSDAAAVTWERAGGASSYLAVGVTADGHYRLECNNTATHCDLSDLLCGQTYNVSVFSHDESCSSLESDRAYVRTVPCVPQDVAVDVSCAEGAMTVSWSPNPEAEYVYVLAVSSTWARLRCNSSASACTIRDLPCGQSYNVTVMSVRDGCESEPSAAVHVYSAPCAPTEVVSRLDCVTNDAWVTWDSPDGAHSYFVLAQSEGGHNSSCSSALSPCSVPDLKCATLYTFYVTAINKDCRSNRSSAVTLQTGPCAFTSVSAATQCDSDTILVEWEVMDDSRIYLVTAEGHDQSILTCNTTFSSCTLQDVRCGMHYSVIVATSSDKCSSLRSPPKKITTAPCVPEDVAVELSCEDNGATVSWAPSAVATSYRVTARGKDGRDVGCVTTANNCSLHGLHCGQLYNLSIAASAHNCSGPPSVTSFRAVPCAPVGLAVDIQCENNSAVLSWNATEGAMEYFGCARSPYGDPLYCESADASCTINGLECGDKYNFSVEASTGACNSSFSAPLLAGAVPCAPNAVDVRLQKIDQTYWVMVSFNAVNCSDVEYQVEISGQIEDSRQAQMMLSSYWTSRTYFEFPLPCSTLFVVVLRSRNSAGTGKTYTAFTGTTVPCPPQNVRYTGDRQSAVLSWDASVFATRYTVYSISTADRVTLCDTAELSCQLSDFDPGTTEVTASNAVGEGNPQRTIAGPGNGRRRRDLMDSHDEANVKV